MRASAVLWANKVRPYNSDETFRKTVGGGTRPAVPGGASPTIQNRVGFVGARIARPEMNRDKTVICGRPMDAPTKQREFPARIFGNVPAIYAGRATRPLQSKTSGVGFVGARIARPGIIRNKTVICGRAQFFGRTKFAPTILTKYSGKRRVGPPRPK